MNDEEASEPTFEDEDEYNNIEDDQNEKNNLYNEDQIDQDDDEATAKARAAMALINRAYNIPNYYNNKLPENYDTSENDQKPTEYEEDEDEEEINDSSIQDDLDTDQEAEINSMYIPGHDEQHDQNNENAYNSSSESGENTSKGNYMSQFQEISPDANKNKRRKPHNPQKLSSALNLLNTKLQNKQRVSELSASEDQEIHDEWMP